MSRGNTALWCKQVCSGSLPFLAFSLSLSLGLSLSSYFFLSALLLYVALLNLGPCWVSLEDEMGPKQECNGEKETKIFSSVLHIFMPSLLFDLL